MCIGRGLTGENVSATPSETVSVRRHRGPLFVVTLFHRTVRKNCDIPRPDPPNRRRSTFWKGSGEADASFIPLTRGSDVRPTAELAQLVKEQNKHYGKRCASPERQCEGCVVTRCRGRRPLIIPMWWVGLLTISPSLNVHSLGTCRYPSRLPTMSKFLGMRVRAVATGSQ